LLQVTIIAHIGFGDWKVELGELDDLSRSNNGDRDKVLATVAFTAMDFTDKYPGAIKWVSQMIYWKSTKGLIYRASGIADGNHLRST
jgi:hypothetical protein